MLRIEETIIVEGTHDKMRLQQYLDAEIIATNGFAIFSDPRRMDMIRQVAEKRGIVVLTDSDRAGFLIRGHLKNCIPAHLIKHAYIPEIKGKERRKAVPGKEGLLGVEGVPAEVVQKALKKAGCRCQENLTAKVRPITKQDLYSDGLSGRPDSSSKRQALLSRLSFPSRLSTNALLEALNALFDYDAYKALLKTLEDNKE